jgi:hypothetical protein
MCADIDVPFSNDFQRRRPVYALVWRVEPRAEHKSQEITVLPLFATIGLWAWPTQCKSVEECDALTSAHVIRDTGASERRLTRPVSI